MRPLHLVALLAGLTPCVVGQRSGTGGGFHHPPHSPAVFFYDPYYSDTLYREGVPTTPSVILLQSPPPPPPIPERPSPPTQPLTIELQAGRYVLISGEDTSTAEMKQIDATTPTRSVLRRPGTRSVIAASSPASQQLAPAILVFRDGRHEEVSDYTITGGVLYTHADYYTDGSWNKKIELSSLNLPDTIAANQSRGIKFQLPTAPNEVIVRP